MKRFHALVSIGILLTGGFSVTGSGQTVPFSSEAREKAESLLKQMTVDEKVGQLNQAAGIVIPDIGNL